jgi:hypothetical protein
MRDLRRLNRDLQIHVDAVNELARAALSDGPLSGYAALFFTEFGATARKMAADVRQREEDRTRAARQHLAGLEAIARYGRNSDQPGEVLAALRVLATPSESIRKLAGVQG